MLKNVNIHVVEDGNNELFINSHTHGMEKYGYKNLCCGLKMDKNDIGYVLNRVAELIVKREINSNNIHMVHCLDELNGETLFKVKLLPAKCFDEECIQVFVIWSKKYYEGVNTGFMQRCVKDIEPLDGDVALKIKR